MIESPSERAQRLILDGRPLDAIRVVQQAARQTDCDAQFLLGMWHLIGDIVPRDLALARRYLRDASRAGHQDALMTEAALAANGSGAPPDWSAAVALLEAASTANRAAAEQLALLSAMALDANGRPTHQFPSEVLASNPTVLRFPSLLKPAECAIVANAAQDLLMPAVVIDPATGRPIPHPVRTSHGAVIGPTRESPVLRAINMRLAAISNTDVAQGEALSVLHYAPGQQYRLHHDCIAGARNQRVMTVLIYLNDGFEGGETYFAGNGLSVLPRTGDAVLFANTDDRGRPDPASQHAGRPVQQGVKWLATRWIRAERFDQWRGPDVTLPY